MSSVESNTPPYSCPSSSSDTFTNHENESLVVAPKSIGLRDPCAVCGGQATAHHYDVPSCNGCKAFFRRTLLGQRALKCKKDGSCFDTISPLNHLSCRACRFEKCVEAGMNPLSVVSCQNAGQNALIRSILARRQRPSSSVNVPKQLTSHTDILLRSVGGLLHAEDRHDAIRRSTYNPRSNWMVQFVDLLEIPSELGKPHMEMPGWPLLKTSPLQPTMEYYIEKRLPVPKMDPNTLPSNVKQWIVADLIYCIDYAKTFSYFNRLPENDKVLLLKNCLLECMYLTISFFSLAQNANEVVYPDGRGRAHLNPTLMADDVLPLIARLDMDRTEYVLLKAILLANPIWDDLSDYARKLIAPVRERYASALFRYCLLRRGAAQGAAAFSALMAVVGVLMNNARRGKQVHELACSLRIKARSTNFIKDIFE